MPTLCGLKECPKLFDDELRLNDIVTPKSFHDQVRSPPAEGVYIHGLFLDGAAWSKQEGVVVESEPKKLFVSLPVLFVSANTKSDQVHGPRIPNCS